VFSQLTSSLLEVPFPFISTDLIFAPCEIWDYTSGEKASSLAQRLRGSCYVEYSGAGAEPNPTTALKLPAIDSAIAQLLLEETPSDGAHFAYPAFKLIVDFREFGWNRRQVGIV
jgi:hypothetical protein